jgi:transglutaminase-like putative cysteine protease
MGIAAEPVGGCVVVNGDACAFQALFLNSFQAMAIAPIYTEANVTIDQNEFSRTSFGRSGGLHAWVTAWDEKEGWLTLEVTSGKFANTKCYNYHVEIYPSNSDKQSICVSTNYNYAKACQLNDLETMNKYGLGLSTEALP